MKWSRTATWRWVRRGVVALCVGVVATYGVAWGLAYFGGPVPREFATIRQRTWVSYEPGNELAESVEFVAVGRGRIELDLCPMTSGDSVWMVREYAKDLARPQSLAPATPAVRTCVAPITLHELELPIWARTAIPGADGPLKNMKVSWITVFGSGFPMISHAGTNQIDFNGKSLRRALARVKPGVAAGDAVLIPTLPVLPGFAVNVLVYAGVWSLTLWTPGAIRAWRRVRRGRCGACGYDVKGIAGGVCPECGSGVEGRKRSEMVKA